MADPVYHIKIQHENDSQYMVEQIGWVARVWRGEEVGSPDFTIRSCSKRLLVWKVRRRSLDRRFARRERERARDATKVRFTR